MAKRIREKVESAFENKVSNQGILAFFSGALGSMLVFLPSWPGFMSYDSLQMIRESRTEVSGGIYPTAPVYLLRFLDFLFGRGPELLFGLQVFVICFSVSLISLRVFRDYRLPVIVTISVIGNPLVYGCMMVLWKDVTLSAMCIVSIALIYLRDSSSSERIRKFSAFNAVPLILIFATCFRFNAIPLTLGIFIYWLRVFAPAYTKPRAIITSCAWAMAAIVVGFLFASIRLPDLKPLPPSTNLEATLAYDLLGMSYHANTALVPFDTKTAKSQKLDLEIIKGTYSPLGVLVMQNNAASLGTELKIFPETYSRDDIFLAWLQGVTSHPYAYLGYRNDIFGEIIGLTDHVTYEPTHFNKVDENDLGIRFSDSFFTLPALGYVYLGSTLVIGKPWFTLALSTIALSVIWRRRIGSEDFRRLLLFTYLSSIAYLAPYYLIAATGEVRYAMPSTLGFSICASLAGLAILIEPKKKSHLRMQ